MILDLEGRKANARAIQLRAVETVRPLCSGRAILPSPGISKGFVWVVERLGVPGLLSVGRSK